LNRLFIYFTAVALTATEKKNKKYGKQTEIVVFFMIISVFSDNNAIFCRQ
jgi:Na+/glutamate symporter